MLAKYAHLFAKFPTHAPSKCSFIVACNREKIICKVMTIRLQCLGYEPFNYPRYA